MKLEEIISFMTTQRQFPKSINDATRLTSLHNKRNDLVEYLSSMAPDLPADTTASEIIGAENPNLANPRVATKGVAEMIIPNAKIPESPLDLLQTLAQMLPYVNAARRLPGRIRNEFTKGDVDDIIQGDTGLYIKPETPEPFIDLAQQIELNHKINRYYHQWPNKRFQNMPDDELNQLPDVYRLDADGNPINWKFKPKW